jgi:hypothetical protein
MPISIEALRAAQKSLHMRVLQFLESRPEEAFSLLEIIEAVEPMRAEDIPLLVATQRKAHGVSELLSRYEAVVSDLQSDAMSGCPVVSAEHGGVRYFGLRSDWRAKAGPTP